MPVICSIALETLLCELMQNEKPPSLLQVTGAFHFYFSIISKDSRF